MNSSRDSEICFKGFSSRLEGLLREIPAAGRRPGVSRAPGVVDVMGGIGEDAGSLVLTATTGVSHVTAVWPTAGADVRVRMICEGNADDAVDFSMSASAFLSGDASTIRAKCQDDDAAWAAPTLLGIHRVISDGIVPAPTGGLAVLVEHDFCTGSDLGRVPSQVTAAADAYCKLHGATPDRLMLAQALADVVNDLMDLFQLRKTLSAIAAPTGGSMLQLRFHPNVLCETLELPQGVIVKAVATRLSRPTTAQRLIETRLCSDMGHRIIQELQKQDGHRQDGARLSSITPAEYVERYRDRMPAKITHQQFVTRFGSIRGLPETAADPKGVFKIRSRAEHHIYENRRVHDFATHIVRARRNNSLEALLAAGELMYASHWSHSQRCGIGGVETDRLVNLIREAGPGVGLFGAKVTAGGDGGELVVLLRDDATAHAALAAAAKRAAEMSQQPVHVFDGSLPGAQHFAMPQTAPVSGASNMAAAGAV